MYCQLNVFRVVLLSAAVALLLGGCVREHSAVFCLAVGEVLPDFEVTDAAGEVVSSSSLRGVDCVIAFVNTACVDCQRELPELQKVYEMCMNQGDDIRFIVIGRTESQCSMEEYWTKQNLTLPYSAQVDDVVYRKFAEHGIPRIFIADGSGIIRFSSEDRSYIPAETLGDQLHLLATSDGNN